MLIYLGAPTQGPEVVEAKYHRVKEESLEEWRSSIVAQVLAGRTDSHAFLSLGAR